MVLSLIGTSSTILTSFSSDDAVAPAPNPNPNPNPDPDPNPNPNPNPEEAKVQITADASQAYLGETVTLTATLEGQDVTSEVTFYVDEVAIAGNTVTSDVAASLLIKGKHPNAIDSDYIEVNFAENPFLGIEGTGSFIYNGTSNDIDGAYLILQGFYPDGNGGATAWWIQYGWSGNNPNTADNLVVISYDTPATLNSSNQVTDFVYPDENQNVYYSIIAARVNGQEMITEDYVNGTGTITYSNLDLDSTPPTSTFNMTVTGEHNITFNYNGSILAGKEKRKLELQAKSSKIKSLEQLQADKANLSKRLLK